MYGLGLRVAELCHCGKSVSNSSDAMSRLYVDGYEGEKIRTFIT